MEEVQATCDAIEKGIGEKLFYSAVKEKGLLRVEGKEYVVNDGDCMHFRFNV